MKPFNLDEYFKNPSKKVITRSGKNARIRCTDVKNELYPVLALVEIGDYESPTLYTADGEFILGQERDFDLFFAPEKHEGWINVYKWGDDYRYTGDVFSSKEKALKSITGCDNVATIKIEWEE